ncbi:MAG: S24/S26 family peptidase [Candidatus Omnitrophica bacterium]|nr:S24/S26 family peptidase [Candidatus Omnitrophota bacterium]
MSKAKEFIIPNVVLTELLEAVTGKRKSLSFEVKGFSMFPFVCNGDIVTVSPFSNTIKVGQVVIFTHPRSQALTLHRVVGKKGNNYIIKGDNALEIDAAVSRQNILGYVSGLERKGRSITLGLGKERCLIVFLSRTRILPLFFRLTKLVLYPARELFRKRLL